MKNERKPKNVSVFKFSTTLKDPANHNLVDIFKELKFGRPADSQKYLDKCIEELENLNT